jgi:uncharacterized repeat protein (TIGR02543 family)
MMKKGFYAFLAVLTVFAMVLTGCPDGDDNTTKNQGTVITLDSNTLSLEVDETKDITATAATLANTRNLTWTSSAPTVATVSAKGTGNRTATITGVSQGTAIITATAPDGGKASCNVTVNAATTQINITLNPTTITMEVDETEEITATVEPNRVLTWTSSAPAVATVSTAGGKVTVTGVSTGTATITATAGAGSATCSVTITPATKNIVSVVGETLVHTLPPLRGVSHFGSNLGTDNKDGSYTFDGTAGAWSGGGAQYNFPAPKPGETWKIDNYQIVEMHLKVTDGSVNVGVKKSGGNVDLRPIPDGASGITFNTTSGGTFTFKTVVGEAGSGIGFQRNTGGPATVTIEKVVFSKSVMHTITFSGGDNTSMAAIEPIKIPDGRTVNYFGSYTMPSKPKWAGHTFTGWYNTTDNTDFDDTAAITKDLTLTAKWEDGDPPPVDMSLNLNPASWPNPLPPNAANQSGGWTWPSEYAASDFSDNKLTLTFNGNNRQRAIIPLSADQIDELTDTAEGGVTFRIVGTVKKEDGTDSSAEFRLHLGNPSATSSWNGTETGDQGALKDHMVEYANFANNKPKSLLAWFMIQAMYKDAGGSDTVQSGFPKVIITIESITIEVGDTR